MGLDDDQRPDSGTRLGVHVPPRMWASLSATDWWSPLPLSLSHGCRRTQGSAQLRPTSTARFWPTCHSTRSESGRPADLPSPTYRRFCGADRSVLARDYRVGSQRAVTERKCRYELLRSALGVRCYGAVSDRPSPCVRQFPGLHFVPCKGSQRSRRRCWRFVECREGLPLDVWLEGCDAGG